MNTDPHVVFERMVDDLRGRGDVPDDLIDNMLQARIAELKATVAMHEADLTRMEASRRVRSYGTLIERNIFTAREVEIMREVEAGLEAMERWRVDQ